MSEGEEDGGVVGMEKVYTIVGRSFVRKDSGWMSDLYIDVLNHLLGEGGQTEES